MEVKTQLIATEIVTESDIEELRKLRNMTSDGFSSFNGQISHQQQMLWWNDMTGLIKGWLYWQQINSTGLRVCVGFGVLRQTDDGKWWNSIGVNPRFQGNGFGSYITHDLLRKHDETIYAVVKRDNMPAMKMHNKEEWIEIDSEEPHNLAYFESKKTH